MNANTILIVDTSLSANPYYDLFRSITKKTGKKFNIINVISDEDHFSLYKNYVEYPGIADYSIHYNDLAKLDSLNITHILNGSDVGYKVYTKLISKYFPNITNQLLDIKINKYELYTYLKSKKIITTNQSIVNSLNYKNTNITKPTVLKPINGAGGKDVFYINSVDELSVLETLQGNFMLQDRIFGDEYSVDFVSSNGVHKLHAIWKYKKNDNHHHREEIDLVNPHTNPELLAKIYKYMSAIFSEIGHQNGPTHSEVMVSDDEINLIEINFRLHGHLGNGSQLLCIGASQAGETIKNYKNPTWTSKLDTYNYYQPLKKILLNNKKEKYIESIDWEEIEKIKSVLATYKHNNLMPGIVPVSTSVQTTLGFIMISNKDHEQFNKDVDTIRSLKDVICN
jgi:hypothetical protein